LITLLSKYLTAVHAPGVAAECRRSRPSRVYTSRSVIKSLSSHSHFYPCPNTSHTD